MLPPLIRDVCVPQPGTLEIHFQVGVYQYKGVPAEKCDEMVRLVRFRSKQPGADIEFFNKSIEGKYPSLRLGM